MSRIQHFLHGTKFMEGAYLEGTPVNEYGEKITGHEPTTPFLADLGASVQGIPGEMVQWWKDAHRWDRPIMTEFKVESDELMSGGGRSIVLVRETDPDYIIWKRLSVVSDAMLVLIVVLIVLLFV